MLAMNEEFMEEIEDELELSWIKAAEILKERGLLQDGSLIEMKLLLELLEIDINKKELYTFEQFQESSFKRLERVEMLKEYLLETEDICLCNVRGQGYMVLHPNDQVDHAIHMHDKALRKAYLKAKKRLTHLRRDKISYSKITLINDFNARLSAYEAIDRRHNLKRQ